MAEPPRRPLTVPLGLPTWQELNRRVNQWATKIASQILNWRSSGESSDWIPVTDDQWIGDSDKHPRGVAVGVPTGDPATPGVHGVMVERTGVLGGNGGVAIVGYRDQETRIINPGTMANAPVEIAGSDVLLMGGVVFIATRAPHAKEHYMLLGETSVLADGRHVAPIMLGPEYVPAQSEVAQDSRDLEIDDSGLFERIVVTLGPLTDSYAAGVSMFTYDVRLSEEGDRSTVFYVRIYVDSGTGYAVKLEDEYVLSGSAQNVSVSVPIVEAVNAGESVQMRVAAVGSNPNSDPWVRGSVRVSRLEMRQG